MGVHAWLQVMAGQGTMALELLEQFSELEPESESESGLGELDAIVVPVSGCGMISGIAIAAKAQYPNLKIIAAEPSGSNNCPDVVMSLEAGELIGPASCGTTLPPIACVNPVCLSALAELRCPFVSCPCLPSPCVCSCQ
jgi:threonine dehydratase